MNEKASGAFVAADIARAVRARGGRALVVGGWVRDRLLEAASRRETAGDTTATRRARHGGVRHSAPANCLPSSSHSARSSPSARVFPSTRSRNIDIGLPRRESKSAPGHKGFRRRRRSVDVDRRGREAARLHGQRHLMGSADRRILRPVQRTRAISTTRFSKPSIPRHSATTVCACCARFSSPRASR